MYQAYQSHPSPTAKTVAEPAPTPVRWAGYLMYAGAAVYLARGIAGLISAINLAPTMVNGMAVKGRSHVPGEIRHALPTVFIVLACLSTMGPVVLWLWMAWKCGVGRRWARILSTILFAFGTLVTVGTAARSTAGFTAAWVAGDIGGWLIGLAVIVLLWTRSSSWFFRFAPRS